MPIQDYNDVLKLSTSCLKYKALEGCNPCPPAHSSQVRLEEVMEDMKLGPNGGLIYCMQVWASNLGQTLYFQFLVENYSWLQEKLDCLEEGSYLLFDCPGQVTTHLEPPANLASR